jgi:hypothetical protein
MQGDTEAYDVLATRFRATCIEPPPNILDLPLSERGLMALKAAVEKVINEHAREGLPLYTWCDGQVVAVPAEEFRKKS